MKQKTKVLVTDPIYADGLRILKEAGLLVDYEPGISAEQLKAIVSRYDVLIVRSRTKVTKQILNNAPRLKIIGRAGSGLDNIDQKESKKRGIKILNTPEAPTIAVAELTIGLIISLLRQIPYANKSMKNGSWTKKECIGFELKGKIIGIIGFGKIGKAVAKIAKSMGMKVLFNDLRFNMVMTDRANAKEVPLKELLKTSDIITVHIPLSSENQRFISDKEFQLMKQGAYFINTSRGAIVDEVALQKAIETGKLAGVALDVYDTEPPSNLSLINLQNVICTPHIGAMTYETQKKASYNLAKKIVKTIKKKQ